MYYKSKPTQEYYYRNVETMIIDALFQSLEMEKV